MSLNFATAPQKPVILLVEDVQEPLTNLVRILKMEYSVLQVTTVSEVFFFLKNGNVQLVITDIRLPETDGIDLCKKIKTDISYRHTPVVLLTPKNAADVRIKGLEVAADACIEKPVSVKHLLVQIRNILHNRKIIEDYFANASAANLKEISMVVPDKDFISQLSNMIYNNISDIELNVDELARLMNMSRPTLYRKIRNLSDQTPNELIHISRLKKGAELLAQKMYNISQVASMVGYSIQSNFSRDFHKHYGMSPSIYIASL